MHLYAIQMVLEVYYVPHCKYCSSRRSFQLHISDFRDQTIKLFLYFCLFVRFSSGTGMQRSVEVQKGLDNYIGENKYV